MGELETEVLVVGAGPVGLALAGDLGWRGRRCLLVERGDGAILQPKMDLVGIRTMEFCRRWGIVGAVEATPYDRDYPQDNVYVTTLTGYELGRQQMPSMRAAAPPPESPQKRERCPQNMFDPVLREFAHAQPSVDLRYTHEFVAFIQSADEVVATVREVLTSISSQVRCKYLVGCDGGRSAVREALGIGMSGRGVLTHTTNVIFGCPDFNARHGKAPGYRYMFVGPQGTWATIVAINGRDQWRMSIVGNAQERPRYSETELKSLAHKAMGKPFELEILSVLRWTREERVAESYGRGRVFICGDACHLTSPTGGLGMNTGIGDAVDLSWKLDAAIRGWGGPGLLESYEIERRPVATRITRFSTANLETMKRVPASPQIDEDSEAGQHVRERVGRAMSEGLAKEWFSLNMHLGNRYVHSPACAYTEPESEQRIAAEFEDAVNYRPSSRPGCRAPHAWLSDGRSTLDLFGRGYVLLALGRPSGDANAMLQAATDRGVPLEVVSIVDGSVCELYEKHFVLVRPDGHVAWRGDALPADCSFLLASLTGNLRREHEHVDG
jgi:2-polyprenyl-6-methoxyphenol hydroxylase-like FAD-dependent oxidoreductase